MKFNPIIFGYVLFALSFASLINGVHIINSIGAQYVFSPIFITMLDIEYLPAWELVVNILETLICLFGGITIIKDAKE